MYKRLLPIFFLSIILFYPFQSQAWVQQSNVDASKPVSQNILKDLDLISSSVGANQKVSVTVLQAYFKMAENSNTPLSCKETDRDEAIKKIADKYAKQINDNTSYDKKKEKFGSAINEGIEEAKKAEDAKAEALAAQKQKLADDQETLLNGAQYLTNETSDDQKNQITEGTVASLKSGTGNENGQICTKGIVGAFILRTTPSVTSSGSSTISPNVEVVDSLLNDQGGILNAKFSFSFIQKIMNAPNPDNNYVNVFLDIGAKEVQASINGEDKNIPVFETLLKPVFNLGLIDNKNENETKTKVKSPGINQDKYNHIGNMIFEFPIVFDYVNDSNYKQIFGNDSHGQTFHIDGYFRLFLAGQLSLSAGGTIFSDNPDVDKRFVISISASQGGK